MKPGIKLNMIFQKNRNNFIYSLHPKDAVPFSSYWSISLLQFIEYVFKG